MGHHPKLALLRQVLEQFGNETGLFDYLSRSRKVTRKALTMLRTINVLVTEDFDGRERDSGKPYVSHLHGVCAIGAVHCQVFDYELLGAALFHDSIEEFPARWTEERIAAYSTRRIATLVAGCSKDPNLSYYDDEEERTVLYYERIANSPEFSMIKVWDRIQNQLTLEFCEVKKQIRKNQETERFVLPIARKYGILAEELEATIQENDERIRRLVATP